MFDSIFSQETVSAPEFFLILLISLVCGVVYAILSSIKTKSSKSFCVATALLPMSVAVVISLVNGNLGVGVAIAGAFGLVRFRSAPGTAREIAIIFIAMASGLAFGMGFVAYGAIFLLFCGVLLFVYDCITAKKTHSSLEKRVKIIIPEVLDYTNVFDDIFAAFTQSAELERVKSVNMGSMFSLTYLIKLKDLNAEKQFIDAIRTRNGNLEITCSRVDVNDTELL